MRGMTCSGVLAAMAASACAQTVYDNGPLITGATLSTGAPAPSGYSWSELQQPNTSAGLTAQRYADDVTFAGATDVQSIDLFAFVSGGSTTTSPFTSATLRIWNGSPGSAASAVVFGNTTTNRLQGSTALPICRTRWALAETTKVVWRLRLAASVSLPAGTYWLDWSLNTGQVPLVTIPGAAQKPGANGLIFLTSIGFWRDAEDGGSTLAQDFPFLINGAGGGGPVCYANCDQSTATPFLNVADFTCFLQRYAAADAFANCDGSTTPPTLNVADFTCFLQKFAGGCSAP
jgi:hypothetical protein